MSVVESTLAPAPSSAGAPTGSGPATARPATVPDQSDRPLFPYDTQLLDRRLLNCCQRHAAVWLERAGVPVRFLFHRALLSSDEILRQIVVGKQPKYALQSGFFTADSLASIGVVTRTVAADRFCDIRETVAGIVARRGFVLLSGDVFYFPHCVEYRNAHAQHVVVLRGREDNGDWLIVDDDPASVLRCYQHTDDAVRDFYDNNTLRVFHDYDLDGLLPAAEAAALAQVEFPGLVAAHEDSHQLLDRIGAILTNPLDAPTLRYRTLHDAFALLSGSRYCLAAYLEAQGWDAATVALARSFAQSAYLLKNLMGKGQLGGRVTPVSVETRCDALKVLDLQLQQALRQNVGIA